MGRTTIDISCDMGEGFGSWKLGSTDDAALMKLISSANIATGFHAGDPNLMDLSVRRALDNHVAIGVHPGYRDLHGFGRRKVEAGVDETINDIIYQVGALREFVRLHGGTIQHVKPHGALYMALAADEAASTAFVDVMKLLAPDTFIYCMEASATYRIASKAGHPVVREFYADREYDKTGKIVFTRKPDDCNPRKTAERVVRACVEGKVRPIDGGDIDIGFESVCVHSDTPGSAEALAAIREALTSSKIEIASPSSTKARAAA